MNWIDVGKQLPDEKFHDKELLCKIDHNCGYMVVLWDNYNKRFMPRSYYNHDNAMSLITGISDWCEILPSSIPSRAEIDHIIEEDLPESVEYKKYTEKEQSLIKAGTKAGANWFRDSLLEGNWR